MYVINYKHIILFIGINSSFYKLSKYYCKCIEFIEIYIIPPKFVQVIQQNDMVKK